MKRWIAIATVVGIFLPAAPEAQPQTQARIRFALHSAQVPADAMPIIEWAVRAMRANPTYEIQVVGENAPEENIMVASRRITAVSRLLRERGLQVQTSQPVSETGPFATIRIARRFDIYGEPQQ